ncbi:MAG: hypothetical protein NUV91_06025 [Candidatus Omnitrophica bacterium]|nr:hypothetical protein [Candidatus Omnitrophota bacterium]
MVKYAALSPEPEWIREGQPVEIEGKRWVPVEDIEILKDSEVLLIAEQQGVQFFVDKVDIKPYNRVYTKFGKNKFRVFELE